jgi:transposase-like protein
MSMVSHLHHLFNPETCQSYIHTLRWKDRPLQCPRCQSLNVGPWGTYHAQPGLKRYRCKEQGCKRTFNDLTGTLLDGSKRSMMHWILATFLLCLSCAYSGDSCHPIQCKAAMQSGGSLPPNPDESCHPIGAQRRLD